MSEAGSESKGVQDGYKRVQIGPKKVEIPEDWEVRKFGDVFDKRREKIEADENETIRYVGLDDIESDNIYLQDFDENGKERSSTRAFREGDVLFGKLRPYLNKAAVAPFDGICSSDIIPIFPTEDADEGFLIYLMHSKVIRDRAISTMSGTNLPRTTWSDIASGEFPCPSIPEQRRIAAVLSTVDDDIRETSEIIEAVEELKTGLMQDVFTVGVSGVGETKSERLLEIPTNWDVRPLSSLTIESSYGPRFSSEEYDQHGNIATLRTTDLDENGDISHDSMPLADLNADEFRDHFLEKGDFIISRSGANCGLCTVWDEFKKPTLPGAYMIRFRLNDELNARFLREFINSDEGQRRVKTLRRGSSQKNLAGSDLLSMAIPVPSRAEQDLIVEITESVNNHIDVERERRDKLQQLKRGLMQDLLTGKVRVDDLEIDEK